MKFIGILARSLFMISCVNPSGQDEVKENQISYEKHVDPENGFAIEYPESWVKIDTMPQPYLLLAVKENNPDTSDKFNESMNLIKLPNEGKSLRQIVDQNLEMIKQYRPDYKVSQSNFETKKGLETILIKAEFEEQGVNLSTTSVFFINSSFLYTLTQTVETSKTEEYKEIFGHSINSFEWNY